MKTWQILTLAGIGLTAVCLVCLASILFLGVLLPAPSPPASPSIPAWSRTYSRAPSSWIPARPRPTS